MHPLVIRFFETTAGMTLADAEGVLDTARRLIWLHVFSGSPFEDVAREIDASRESVDFAVLAIEETARTAAAGQAAPEAPPLAWPAMAILAAMDALGQDIRLTLYIRAFQDDRGTLFGQFARSFNEEELRYSSHPAGRA